MVSVIVPVYNAEEGVGKCIESILQQTYPDIELILIDDGSVDGSKEICQNYAEQDARIVFKSRDNQGVSKTRNEGIHLARGQYIQFVDSDDYIAKTMIEEMVKKIEDEGTDLVICGWREYCAGYDRTELPSMGRSVKKENLKTEYPEIFKRFHLNPPWNKLYKKDKITSGFPEDMSLGEDLIFNLHYLRNIVDISFLERDLYHYIIRSQGLTRKYRDNGIDIAERVYKESIAFCEELDLGEVAREDISNIFMNSLLWGLSDLYCFSGYGQEQRRAALSLWINTFTVSQAVSVAKLQGVHRKIAQFLIKHKSEYFLDKMFRIKKLITKQI